MLMRLDEMQAFLGVVDYGSFQGAAKALGLSRSTLRRQVEALETRLGVPLFSRTSGGVTLTDAGRRLALGARSLEREYLDLLGGIQEEGREFAGELRILVPCGMTPHGMATGIDVLRAAWPGLRLQFSVREDPLSLDPSESDIFVYFGTAPPPGPWRSEILAYCPQRLVAGRAYLERSGTPPSVEELALHDLLVWHLPSERPGDLLPRATAKSRFRISVASIDAHLLHELAHSGAGIAYVPDGGLPVADDQEPLVPVLEGQVGRQMQIRVAAALHVAQMPKVRLFLDQLEELASRAVPAKPRQRSGSG